VHFPPAAFALPEKETCKNALAVAKGNKKKEQKVTKKNDFWPLIFFFVLPRLK
jgi:hypothetical protein